MPDRDQVNLKVILTEPVSLDFAWYEAISAHFVRKTVDGARRLLDVGCGRGKVLLGLSRYVARGTGLDISVADIATAERTRRTRGIGNVRFRVGDAARLPFRSASFDVVLCMGDVMSSYNLYGKSARVFAEIHRVLGKGGTAIHECTNWDWEYRSYPSSGSFFVRQGKRQFSFHRGDRTRSGKETTRNFDVLSGTVLHRWVLRRRWPVCPQGWNTRLTVEEVKPIPPAWLEFTGVSRGQHFTPSALGRGYMKAGFKSVEVIPYGQTYDVAYESGKLKQVERCRTSLARAEAELILRLRQGSGPWQFAIARK